MPPVADGLHPGESPLLTVRNLEVTFGDESEPVLHGVDFELRRGESVAIVGQSGSGKSTVIGAILRLLPGAGHISNGSIILADDSPVKAGIDLAVTSEKQMRLIRGRRIGFIPQDPASNLNPAMKIGAQIADTLIAHGLRGRGVIRQRVMQLMGEAGIPDAVRRSAQFPHELSGGMRQRVLIAIALAREPELLIADEPTSALDVTVQRQILDHLQVLVDARGTTLLFVTHDLGVAADRTDRIIVMLDGRIVEVGTPAEIILNPQHEYTRRLVAAAPTAWRVAAVELGPVNAVLARPILVPPILAPPILVVEHLVKEFRLRGPGRSALRAVDDVTFVIPRGTTTAIVGESGSGKTTLARIVLGLERATSGTALIDGRALAGSGRAELKALRREMQPVFQDPYASLDPTYSIERLIDEPLRIFQIGDRMTRRARVAELLDQVALAPSIAQRRPNELSGGQRQRVAIARALALEPQLLICDEAVSALDVLVQDQILRLLGHLQRQLGISYLFITHDLAVVRQIANSVIVMRQGRIMEHGTVETVFAAPQAAYTAELLEAIPGGSRAR